MSKSDNATRKAWINGVVLAISVVGALILFFLLTDRTAPLL